MAILLNLVKLSCIVPLDSQTYFSVAQNPRYPLPVFSILVVFYASFPHQSLHSLAMSLLHIEMYSLIPNSLSLYIDIRVSIQVPIYIEHHVNRFLSIDLQPSVSHSPSPLF